ncbi:MAG: aminotransferase class V-fold PLP-dependent enzyme [Prolixibacteraceae bacterium]
MTIISKDIVHLLPGPVEIDLAVKQEFSRLPESHRGDEFKLEFKNLKTKLCRVVNSRFVEVLSGSGTLANDAIAAQLSQHPEQGLILSNGEFGERITSQASRFDLNFHSITAPWGEPFDYKEIADFIDRNQEIKWIWAVHCETSTGVLTDWMRLSKICLLRNIKLCLDCISSIGAVPVNLENVYLASCSSGKAICSFPGLSMVFYNHEIEVLSSIPKYLDLGFFRRENGMPFTISSNLVLALIKAVDLLDENEEKIYSGIVKKSVVMREALQPFNLKIINDSDLSSPSVVTIELPDSINSVAFGKLMEQRNCFINYNSGYLIKRNWVQTFITRNTSMETILRFADLVRKNL